MCRAPVDTKQTLTIETVSITEDSDQWMRDSDIIINRI